MNLNLKMVSFYTLGVFFIYSGLSEFFTVLNVSWEFYFFFAFVIFFVGGLFK